MEIPDRWNGIGPRNSARHDAQEAPDRWGPVARATGPYLTRRLAASPPPYSATTGHPSPVQTMRPWISGETVVVPTMPSTSHTRVAARRRSDVVQDAVLQ